MGRKPSGGYEDSELVQKGPCPDPDCGSSDGCALYSDGHRHCFVCTKTFRAESVDGVEAGELPASLRDRPPEDGGELAEAIRSARPVAIKSRGLTQATCKALDYLVRQRPNGDYEQLAPYRDRETGALVGVKVRNTGPDGRGKEFYWIGSSKDQLWGAHRYSGGGRVLTVCEGEIDTATVAQAYALKYAVVGVPNGAAESEKAIKKNLAWVNTFDKVVFALDMDDPGRRASIACAKLLPPGKAFIAKWEAKDPNEMLQEGKGDRITWCVHTAEAYRPDGIVDARSLTAEVMNPPSWGIPWPWDFMTKWTYGRRPCELIILGSGTGMGKTDILAEIVASTITGLTKEGFSYPPAGFGVFGYEASAAITKLAIAGKIAGKRFHIPQEEGYEEWTSEDLRAAMDLMDGPIWNAGGKLFINDAKGAADWDSFKERVRYLHHAEGICHFIGDPMSAWVAGEEDERKMLDNITLEGAALSVELQSTIYFASHLTRPALGPTHEEGGHVKLGQFRGSNGIGMFANFVFGLERNQQAEDEAERAVATIRVVKDRFTGNSIGKTSRIVYNAQSGSYDLPSPSFLED